jgi:hypothetical protein
MDLITTPLASFQFSASAFSTMNSIADATADLNTLSTTLQAIVTKINSNTGSSSIDTDFVAAGGGSISFAEASNVAVTYTSLITSISDMMTIITEMRTLAASILQMSQGISNGRTAALVR